MSIHKRPSGGYEVRWREGSRNRGRRFDRKKDAQDFQDHVRRQSQLGEVVVARTGTVTLSEFFVRWLGARRTTLSPRTVALYADLFRTHINAQLGYVPLLHLTHERLEEWQAKRLAAGAGASVIAKASILLGQVFKQAQRQGKINKNPAEWLEKPKQRSEGVNPATPKQVEMIRAWFIERKHKPDAVLVSLMAYGGLRVGEALALGWQDFKHGESLWIERSLEDDGTFKGTKNEIKRLVKLPEAAAQDLLVWRRESGAEDLVFPRAKDGKGWTKTDRNNWRRRWFSEAAKSAGLESFPPKNLRHSCASLMIAAGHPPTEVASYLGHSLAVSVRVYQRLMEEMKGRPVRSVDEMIAEARKEREHAHA